MRTIDFWCDRANNRLVQGINAANILGDVAVAKNNVLQLVVHDVVPNAAIPALTPYVEQPVEFSTIRFAIGNVDTAPLSGSFKLKVGDQTTSALSWPADLSTPTLVATWKASVLAALKALSTVGSGGVISVDPAGTPAHFFYFQWTDTARTTAIEVVELKLIPWIDATVSSGLSAAGYTQLVKLKQFPLAMTSNFTRPSPPAVSIIETRPGASGTNEEQTLVIPQGAMGSFSLQWAGASTVTMAVDTVTAASIAAALNALVTGGASFTCEQRTATDGSRFAIGFVGPLAGAAQVPLVVAMHDQINLPYATGTLDLTDHLGIEEALNGKASTTLTMELVIAETGDETFIRPIIVLNDMTVAGTEASAAAAGAVVTLEKTVYIDAGMGDAFAEASPGLKFVPPAAGSSLVITHGLNTWRPGVRLTLHAVDHTVFAADPTNLAAALTGSRQLTDSEFTEVAVSANTVHIALPWTLVNDPTSDYDYRLLAVDVYSPDTQLLIFPHKHDWDAILESLPSGQSLRTKLAALDAALTTLAGGLKLTPDRLDMTALATSLISLLATDSGLRSQFTTLLTTLITDPAVMTAITSNLSQYPAFTDAVKTIFTDTTLLAALTNALKTSTDFQTLLRTTVLDTIQALNSASIQNDLVVFTVPDLAFTFPNADSANAEDADGNVDGFFPLPAAQFGSLTNDGNITGPLPAASAALKGHYRTVVTAAHSFYRDFADGQIVFCTGDEWFPGVLDSGKMFTTDGDITVPFVVVNDRQLVDGSRFGFLAGLQIAQTGNCDGRWLAEVKVGHFSAESGPGNINAPVWDATILSQELQMSAVGVTHNIGYAVERTALACTTTNTSTSVTVVNSATLAVGMTVIGDGIPAGATIAAIPDATHFTLSAAATATGLRTVSLLSATKTLYVTTTPATAPSGGTFVFGIFLSRYDTQNVATPRGLVTLSMKGTVCSIAKL